MSDSILVVTNCTNRKRSSCAPITAPKVPKRAPLPVLLDAWLQKLNASRHRIEARRLYLGRSFSDAVAVSDRLNAQLLVVSAGLGLISGHEEIPHYNLTVSPGKGSLLPVLNAANATPADWWQALNKKQGKPLPLSKLLAENPKAVALVALPSNYIGMLAGDFAALTPSALARLRIFTSEPGRAALPEHIRLVAMPYDDRLEGSSYAGTRTDFPQRSLRHFVEVLKAQGLPANPAARRVSEAIADMRKPELPPRARKSDEEIRILIKDNWATYDGSSSRLLRYLRDDVLVACEQSRFRDLWRDVRDELGSAV